MEQNFFGFFGEYGKRNVLLRLVIKPYNPKEFVQPILELSHSTLHLSGTLIPQVYENLTGLKNFTDNYKYFKTMESGKKISKGLIKVKKT